MGTAPRTAIPTAWPSMLVLLGFAAALYVPVALDTGLWDPGETTLALAIEAASAEGEVLQALAPEHPHAILRPPLLLATHGAALTLFDGAGLRLPGLLVWLLLLATAHLVLSRWVGTARALVATTLLAASPAALLGATHALVDGMVVGLQSLTLLIILGATTAPEPSRERTFALTAAGSMTALVLLTGGALSAFVVLGTIAITCAITRQPAAPGDSSPLRRVPVSVGVGLLTITGVLLGIVLSRGEWAVVRPLWLLLAAIAVPSSVALLVGQRSVLHTLAARTGVGFWAAFLITAVLGILAAASVAGVEPVIRSLAVRPYLVGLTVPSPIQFDHGIRWASFSIFPVVVLVPLGFAWLTANRAEAGPGTGPRRLLLAWATVAYLAHILAGPAAGAPVPPVAVPLVLACALAMTDTAWFQALRARSPAVLSTLGLTALLLLLMASRDVRGTRNLELGRPGPHVIFEPALLDGALPFPESYAFALIRLFLALWFIALALLFWGPTLPGLKRVLAHPRRAATASGLFAAAFAVACAAWGVELSLRDFPHMANHSSTRDIAHSAAQASPDGPIAVVGAAAEARGWYLRTPPVIPLDDAADLRRFLCSPEGADARPVAIVPRDEWPRVWSQLRRPVPPHRADRSLPEHCAEPQPVAVLDDRGERHLLIASVARPGETDRNPLLAVLSEPGAIPDDATRPEPVPQFGGGLRLVAWRVSPQPDADRRVHVEMWWEVERSVAGSWQAFLHAEAPGRRIVVDSVPAGGLYPVADWVPGEIVHDRLVIDVPRRVPSEEWTVYAGFFRGETRMPIAPDAPDDRQPLGRFRTP